MVGEGRTRLAMTPPLIGPGAELPFSSSMAANEDERDERRGPMVETPACRAAFRTWCCCRARRRARCAREPIELACSVRTCKGREGVSRGD